MLTYTSIKLILGLVGVAIKDHKMNEQSHFIPCTPQSFENTPMGNKLKWLLKEGILGELKLHPPHMHLV